LGFHHCLAVVACSPRSDFTLFQLLTPRLLDFNN
jgi:hypothetical protein